MNEIAQAAIESYEADGITQLQVATACGVSRNSVEAFFEQRFGDVSARDFFKIVAGAGIVVGFTKSVSPDADFQDGEDNP